MFRGFLCVIRNCLLIVLGFRQSVHAVFMFNVDLSFFFKILAFLSSFVFMIKLRGRLQRFPNTSLSPHIYMASPIVSVGASLWLRG